MLRNTFSKQAFFCFLLSAKCARYFVLASVTTVRTKNPHENATSTRRRAPAQIQIFSQKSDKRWRNVQYDTPNVRMYDTDASDSHMYKHRHNQNLRMIYTYRGIHSLSTVRTH